METVESIIRSSNNTSEEDNNLDFGFTYNNLSFDQEDNTITITNNIDWSNLSGGYTLDDDVTVTNGQNTVSGQSVSWSFSPSNSTGTVVSVAGIPCINLLAPMPKSKIQYVVELLDGSTLELREQQVITPREMIGIVKFINMANNYIASNMTGAGLSVMWSDFITNLKIDKHFVPGQPRNSYDANNDTLYVFLIDQQ